VISRKETSTWASVIIYLFIYLEFGWKEQQGVARKKRV
jgi:hypothetical protein